MQIHISRDGQSFGPYSDVEVRNYLGTGHIKASDLAWQEGQSEWKPLNTLPGFEGYSALVPPVIPTPAIPEADYHHVSTFKFIVLSIVTFGIYDLYWFYKNWKFIRNRDGSSISPFWRMFFAPIWCYSLSKDVTERKGDSNLSTAALVALSYFVLSILWRLPDPYWLFGFFTFVPLLHTVWQIDQINRSKSTRASYYSRFKVWHIILCLIGTVFLTFTVASTLNVIPSTQVVEGERLPKRYVNFMRDAEIINKSESILYFYSTGFLSIKEDGNLITTERVVSYEIHPETGEFNVYSAEYKDIEDIDVTPSESPLDDTIVRIAAKDGDEFYLFVSAEEKRDQLFIDKLMELWKQHKPQVESGEQE